LPNDLLPDAITPSLARRLLDTTLEGLAKHIARGEIHFHPGSVDRALVSRADVERVLGRSLTLAELAAAYRRGEARSQANKKYYLRRLIQQAAQALLDNHRLRPRRSDGGYSAPAAP
jgi:hypothetical protein